MDSDPKKLLIVDDSSFARRKLKEAILLERAEATIIEAVDGEDALAKIGSETPDVCITDLVMPKMDGIAFLQTLKSSESNVKVVVVSADIQDARKQECFDLGVFAFVEKPVTKAKMADLFKKLSA